MKNNNKSGKNSNLFESLVDVTRVSKVTKGGRRFAYRAIVLVSNGKDYVSYGIATHVEVAEAKAKATAKAKNQSNALYINLKDGHTIHHEVWGKFNSAKVFLKPAVAGAGIIAGGSVRKVCSILGITDIIAKSYGSSKSHNVIMAVFKALGSIALPSYIAKKRGKKVSEIIV